AYLDEQRMMRTGVPLVGKEEKETWPDGRETWVSSTKMPLYDGEGRIVSTFGVSRDITERKRAEFRLAVQYATTRVLAECATLKEAGPRILQAVGDTLAWEQGALWTLDGRDDGLRCLAVWHTGPAAPVPEPEAPTRTLALPSSASLPAHVRQIGEPVWVADIRQHPAWGGAAPENARGTFAFPIRLGDETLGVAEFSSRRPRLPDNELLVMFAAIGSQIGQFMERERAQAALK